MKTEKNSSVKVICYGQEEVWDNRADAARFYLEAMAMSEGSEKERYANIFQQLVEGYAVCSDM